MNWQKAAALEKGSTRVPSSWLHLHYYEALNTLFRVENALRVFVYSVLKNEYKEKWVELSITTDDTTTSSIASVARKRMAQADNFAYLGYRITCPIMHLTSGELIRLITHESYWPLFSRFFPGKKEIIHNKLEELGAIRNALAHFRPIQESDVEVIKINSGQALLLVEAYLYALTHSRLPVPSNCTDKWYASLKGLGSPICELGFTRSDPEEWVRVSCRFSLPVLLARDRGSFISCDVLNVLSSKMLRSYPALERLCIYAAESQAFARVLGDRSISARKTVTLTFSKKCLEEQHEAIRDAINALITRIQEETTMIQEDNMARGELVTVASLGAYERAGEEGKPSRWVVMDEELKCEVRPDDPFSYWGAATLGVDDIVAKAEYFPWMPVRVCSEDDRPF